MRDLLGYQPQDAAEEEEEDEEPKELTAEERAQLLLVSSLKVRSVPLSTAQHRSAPLSTDDGSRPPFSYQTWAGRSAVYCVPVVGLPLHALKGDVGCVRCAVTCAVCT